ncbi:uncharacterized protein BDV17DRAFT_299517 [Aspergillus undulatus]|uniref:uncharacterized protein n=1 Tax=Aspergillus undulatus TaxID=1810928 RepID=UPI003CCCE957
MWRDIFLSFILFLASATATGTTRYIQSSDFRIGVDTTTGALLSIAHPRDNASMSWISGPENTPWQPTGSRWGLGYVDLGPLHRTFWASHNPDIAITNDSITATYTLDGVTVDASRTLDSETNSLQECYTFTNTGNDLLTLHEEGTESIGIYTPFNDHYTSTADVLENRAHAHVWANGGSSSWVKLTRMGLRGPHLGLVLTEGSLSGYSIEARSPVTLSNTRGFFLLHPDFPALEGGEERRLCWSLFWHEDWDEFFEGAIERSSQFLHIKADKWTAFHGQTVNLTVSGQRVKDLASEGLTFEDAGDGSYMTSIRTDSIGEQEITFTVEGTNSTVVLNVVPDIDDLIDSRVEFITTKQQLATDFTDQSKAGAYAVYDNEMEAIVTFSTSSDRNTARERLGMGVLAARWLLDNQDADVENSLRIYYNYVINKLQEPDGYVRSWPIGATDGLLRLYNFPWAMQLHLLMAKLGNEVVTSHGNYTASPSDRLLQTIKRFYQEDTALDYYPINLPIIESLSYFNSPGVENKVAYNRLLSLFSAHGKRIAELAENYPASEVNYEQSIVAPAAIILLELYHATNDTTWLTAAKGHFDRLLAFSGRQPDFHLHDIAIRHWDGYWFGKDRMWGDTFPHYWSTLTAIAMQLYGEATGEKGWEARAEGILRGNLVLFDGDGRGHCAFIYPTTVDGRAGHYNDPYANDQDWALAHILMLRGRKNN